MEIKEIESFKIQNKIVDVPCCLRALCFLIFPCLAVRLSATLHHKMTLVTMRIVHPNVDKEKNEDIENATLHLKHQNIPKYYPF